jgi:hypothetical protein
MKKILLFAAVFLLLAGCKDDETVVVTPVDPPVRGSVAVTATINPMLSGGSETFQSEWSEGDVILVSYGGVDYAYSATGSGTSAEFQPVSMSLPENASGAVAAYFNAAGGGYSVPTDQTGLMVPMYAYQANASVSEGKMSISFNPLASIFALTISEQDSKSLARLTLEPADPTKVTGVLAVSGATVDPATGQITVDPEAETSDKIVVETGNVALDADKTVYFAINNGVSIEGGIIVTIECTDGSSYQKTLLEDATLAFNGNYIAASTELFFQIIINTYDDMVYFAEQCAAGNGGAVVELRADIDMNNVAWTPIANFTGTFNGNGKKIYNINVSTGTTERWAGFFGYVKGVVSDVIFGSKDGTTYDGASKVELGYSGTEWAYAGVIAQTNSTIDNVINFVPVTVTASSNCKARVGGVVGTVYNGELTDCKNYGAVTNAATAGVAGSLTGGITGLVDGSSEATVGNKVSGCYNYGAIADNIGGALSNYVGGIAGGITATAVNVLVEKCVNEGTVTFGNGTGSAAHYIGGIVANVSSGSTGKITECENKGVVSSVMNGNCFIGGIGGRVYAITVEKCTNNAEVKFVQTNASGGGYVCIGGILGQTYAGCTVSQCENKAQVSSDKKQVSRIGGIVGTQNAGIVDGCINRGKVMLNFSTQNGNWQAIGGISGFHDAGTAQTDNSHNYGEVSATVNSTHANVGAGGIVGIVQAGTTKGNTNDGTVSLTNTGGVAYAGGVIGYTPKANADGTGTVQIDNTNTATGTVTAVGAASSNAAAGGVIGYNMHGAVGTSKNLAAVTCTKYAGSIAGWNAKTINDATAGGSVNSVGLNAENVSTLAVGKEDGTSTSIVFGTN